MQYLYYALLAVNLFGAGATLFDKRRAARGGWRVRERTLFLFCFFGGCPGVYLTMRAIHHKTLHKRFMWGIPAIFLLQICACAAAYWFLFGRNTL